MLLLLRVCRATSCQGGPFLAAHWHKTTPWRNVCLWIQHGLKGCMWARFPNVSHAMPKGHSHCHSTFVGMVDSQAPQFGNGSPSGHSTQSMSKQHHPPSHHLVCQLRVPNWCVKPAVRVGCAWPSSYQSTKNSSTNHLHSTPYNLLLLQSWCRFLICSCHLWSIWLLSIWNFDLFQLLYVHVDMFLLLLLVLTILYIFF